MRIVPILIQKGYYVHPYVGLTSATLTSDLAETINSNLPTNFKGVYVDHIKKMVLLIKLEYTEAL